MKTTLKQISLLLLLIAMSLFAFASCDPGDDSSSESESESESVAPAYSLCLEASKTAVVRGDAVTLTAVLRAEGAEDIPSEDAVYTVVSGAGYVSLEDNVLTVLNTAPDGATVTVQAREGVSNSNTVTLTVSVPATQLVISANGVTNILAGQSIVLMKTVTPSGAPTDVTWTVTEGTDIATTAGDVLFVNAQAATGRTVKVKATLGTLESNELSFTVGYPLTDISISIGGVKNLLEGDSVTVTPTLTPYNTTDRAYGFVFSAGEDAVTVNGNTLTVNEGVATGTVVKFKAVVETIYGKKESTDVSFTVGYPLTNISISIGGVKNVLEGDSVTVVPTLTPSNTTNGAYTFVFSAGEDAVTVNGNTLTVNEGVATGTVVKFKAVAGDKESSEVSFTVGYPLERIEATLVGSANVMPGSRAQLVATLTPSNTTNGAYRWEFVEGAEFADLADDGFITVKTGVELGSVIKVKAVATEAIGVESEPLTIVVDTPIETITVSAELPDVLDRGASYPVSLSATPADASLDAITWVVNEAAKSYISVSGGRIFVANNTPAGLEVSLKAVSGDVESEPLTFTVGVKVTDITIDIGGEVEVNIDPKGTAVINTVVLPTNATDKTVEWKITEGENYATVANGIITVKDGAPIGATVVFHAEAETIDGVKTSNDITVTVGVKVTGITIDIGGEVEVNIDPKGTAVINTVVLPTNATDKTVEWKITEGGDYATVANGIITVKDGAPIGAKIVFHAEAETIDGVKTSNDITVTIGVPVESVTVDTLGSADVVKGNTVGLSATVHPTDATEKAITWVFVIDGENAATSPYATIKENTLMVNADAPTGTKLVVKAIVGGVESTNAVTVTVQATQEEINAAKLFIDLSADTIRVDKNGASATPLSAEVFNGNWDPVEDAELLFSVIDGAEYLGITQNGNVCSFTAKGHGTATVEVKVVGYDVTETVTVDVIVPPEAIDLPEVFKDRPLYTYNFSYINHSTNEAETLPFVPTPRGELVCQDLVYSFEHESGQSGDSVAVYENGAITFKQLGKVTVTVTSSSGSRMEATATYTFNINDGYNVYNYTELRTLIYSPSYDGQEINVVVLEKPDGSATGYTYGYDLVPPAALKADPTVAEIYACARIQAVNKSLHLNGNKHKIDASQLRPFTVAEYNEFAESAPGFETSDVPNIYTLFSVEAWTETGEESADTKNVSRSVYLHDLEVVGNCPIDYGVNSETAEFSSESGGALGVYGYGISIGSSNYTSHYYIDVDNVTASAFSTGIRFSGVVNNGTASNLHAYNCYSTGILVQSSIMTLKNLTFGPCGATGIEISPDYCEEAGLNDNENQSVSLVGNINASTNLNDGNTMYFQKYTVAGVTIPYIIDGNCAMYTDGQLSHIRNENGQYCFVALIFNNIGKNLTNTSEIVYPAFQEGGIVDITSLPTDGTVNTTHQYIRMEIMVTLPSGTASAGTALFYNMNYNG